MIRENNYKNVCSACHILHCKSHGDTTSYFLIFLQETVELTGNYIIAAIVLGPDIQHRGILHMNTMMNQLISSAQVRLAITGGEYSLSSELSFSSPISKIGATTQILKRVIYVEICISFLQKYHIWLDWLIVCWELRCILWYGMYCIYQMV